MLAKRKPEDWDIWFAALMDQTVDALIDVSETAAEMAKTIDRVLQLTGQVVTVDVNGRKMRFDMTSEIKESLATLDRVIEEALK